MWIVAIIIIAVFFLGVWRIISDETPLNTENPSENLQREHLWLKHLPTIYDDSEALSSLEKFPQLLSFYKVNFMLNEWFSSRTTIEDDLGDQEQMGTMLTLFDDAYKWYQTTPGELSYSVYHHFIHINYIHDSIMAQYPDYFIQYTRQLITHLTQSPELIQSPSLTYFNYLIDDLRDLGDDHNLPLCGKQGDQLADLILTIKQRESA